MHLISFDALRGFGIPETTYIKPENLLEHVNAVNKADWLLFPEYWQVNALYYGMKKPIFPSISTYHIGHNKIEMSRVFQLLWPEHVPETHILPNTCTNRQLIPDVLDFPFVAKTPKESMGKGVWLIDNLAAWENYADTHDIFYVQEYLPIDRDLRLIVIGRKVVTGYWRCCPPGGFHANLSRGGGIDLSAIPDNAIELVETIARTLNVDHAGFDIAEMDGRLYIFEFNRLFGTAGLIQKGIKPGLLIYDYLKSKTQPTIKPPVFPTLDTFRRAS